MLQSQKYEQIDTKIYEFVEVMLLREKVKCDRTWVYSLERFFTYLKEISPEKYPNFNEEVINQYITHLQSLNKNPNSIVNTVTPIIEYAKYLRMGVNREKIQIPKVEKEEHPVIEDEEDIFKTEKHLFDLIMEYSRGLSLTKEPTLEELHNTPYGKLRDILRNYLMFRLVLEIGLDVGELAEINIDSLSSDGTITVNGRRIPLSFHKIFLDYVNFREKFDLIIFKQKVMHEISTGKKEFTNLNQEMLEFLEMDQSEKLEVIESLLLEQISIEDKIQELDGEIDQDEKIEELENKLDNITEKVIEMKMLMVYERKVDEYQFNPAMFVSDRYTRLEENDILKLMELHSFPIYMIQNTTLKKWEDEDMEPNIVGKLIGSKAVSNTKGEDLIDDFRKVIEAGYHFPERSFL